MQTIKDIKCDAVLVAAPWLLYYYPSIPLGLLKAYAGKQGFNVRAEHWHLAVADALGPDLYEEVADTEDDFGDLLFSRLFYPELRHAATHRVTTLAMLRAHGWTLKDMDRCLSLLKRCSRNVLDSLDWGAIPCVGFSLSVSQLMASLFFAREIKRRSPDTQIVFGGFRCRGELGEWLFTHFDFIDYLVQGEGERAFVSILERLTGKADPGVPLGGVWERSAAGPCRPPAGPEPVDLDALPAPDYDEYFEQLGRTQRLPRDPVVMLEASRGCSWGRCRFCVEHQNTAYRHRSRASVEHMLDETTRRYGSLRVIFTDREFPAADLYGPDSPPPVRRMAYIELSVRPDVKKATLQRLYGLGVRGLTVGIEAFSEGSLRKLCKGTRVIDNLQIAKWSKEMGFKTSSCMIINYPGMTSDELRETLDTIERLPYRGIQYVGSPFLLEYRSPYLAKPEAYGISRVRPHRREKTLFPREISRKMVTTKYEFSAEGAKVRGTPIKVDWSLDLYKHTLLYLDNGEVLVLYCAERRLREVLRDWERELYLFCDAHRSWRQIVEAFPSIESPALRDRIRQWAERGFFVVRDDRYMALAYRLDGVFI